MPQPNSQESKPKTGEELIDMYFLHARSALLETAATLDRVRRTGGDTAMDDARITQLRRACEIIAGDTEDRVEQILMMLSEDAEGGLS